MLGAIASTAAVWKGSADRRRRADLQGARPPEFAKLYRYAFIPAVVTALGMLVMLAGTLAFGGLAHAALPDWFASNQGLLLTNTSLSYGITVVIMVLSTAVAFFGLLRGFSARKMT